MEHLKLLFTKDGLQHQLCRGKNVTSERTLVWNDEETAEARAAHLAEIVGTKGLKKISVISALNHFTMMPAGFKEHELGLDLIALNAPVDKKQEQLMLAINKKFDVQFYYAFPNAFYEVIKKPEIPASFNFSGEQFLNSIRTRNQKEIHINLYGQQCEFVALDRRKVTLYNNLDVSSEVDFLYFIMFTISKIGFGLNETQFYVYGETTENETFISELRKFVKKLKIVFDNIPQKNFILNIK